MIFVDSDAYLALNVDGDAHYAKALELSVHLQEHHEELFTTWEVIDEVTTKLSYHVAKKVALDFLQRTLSSDVHIEYVTALLIPDIEALFKKQTSKKVSLTDCTNVIIARQLGIKTFFSFDHHYEQNGFTLLAKRS